MRRWHRWAATPAGLFLFFIALTGVLLHLDMIRLGESPPGSGPQEAPQIQAVPSDEELAAMIARIAGAARSQNAIQVSTLQISLSGPRITLTAGAGGPPGSPQIRLDAASGRPIVGPPPPVNFHYFLQDIHAGYSFGWTGRIVSILAGLALMVLSATGLHMWWTMRRRGKKGFYWK